MEPIAFDEQPSESRSSDGSDVDKRPQGKRAVLVEIGGHEYRIRSDANEEWLLKVAGAVDDAMRTIRSRTNTVDSVDVAILTALNIARELIHLRDVVAAGVGDGKGGGTKDSEAEGSIIEPEQLQGLIEAIELELDAGATSQEL